MRRKGFTLIELLVVVAIIGLIATIAVVALGSARQKSRDAKRLADVRQFQAALELYYTDKAGYPAVPGPANPIVLGTGSNTAICDSGNGIVASCGAAKTYMGTVPHDPSSNAYNYNACNSAATCPATACTTAPCGWYQLNFTLEGAVGGLGSGAHSLSPTGIQ